MRIKLNENKTVEFIDGSGEVNTNDVMRQVLEVETESGIIAKGESLWVVFDKGNALTYTSEIIFSESNGIYNMLIPREVLQVSGAWQLQLFIRLYSTTNKNNYITQLASDVKSFTVTNGLPVEDGVQVNNASIGNLYNFAKQSAENAAESETEAEKSATRAEEAAFQAAQSAEEAEGSAQQAAQSATKAMAARNEASSLAVQASTSARNAESYAAQALKSKQNAESAKDGAVLSASAANTYAGNAFDSANNAQAYSESASQSKEAAIQAKEQAVQAKETATTQASEALSYKQDAKLYAERAEAAADQTKNLYRYKGSVQTFADLPTSGQEIGDTYNVIEKYGDFGAGTNFAWNGEVWDALGGSFDASNLVKKSELSEIGETGYLSDAITDVNHRTVSDVEKEEWNAKQDALIFDTLPTEGSANPVTSGGIKTALDGKADKGEIPQNVVTTDVFNEAINSVNVDISELSMGLSETNTNLSLKADKTVVDELQNHVNFLDAVVEQAGIYTVTEVEDKYTVRETAGGLNIVDGIPTAVKKIQGSTVRTTNLIPYPYSETTKTVNGITFNDNGDGSITVNGTATDTAVFYLFSSSKKLIVGVYIGNQYTISIKNGATYCYLHMNYYDSEGTAHYVTNTIQSSPTFTVGEDWTGIDLYVVVSKNATINNITVYPMLNEGETATEYVPYFKGFKNAYFNGIMSTGSNLMNMKDRVEKNFGSFGNTETRPAVAIPNSVFYGVTANNYYNKSELTSYSFDEESGVYSLVLNELNSTGYGIGFNFKVIPGMPLYVYSDVSGGLNSGERIGFYDKKYNHIPYENMFSIWTNGTKVPDGAVYANAIITGSRSEIPITFSKIVISTKENSVDATYISDDSFSLSASVELQEWDYIDVAQKKLFQATGNVELNGTEYWVLETKNENIIECYNHLPKKYGFTNIICDKLKIGNSIDEPYSINGRIENDAISICLPVSEASTLEELKNWLSNNNLKVAYESNSPTEVTVSLPDGYTAYKNGSEEIVQGDTDNSIYGAENTVSQAYYTLGGTGNEN